MYEVYFTRLGEQVIGGMCWWGDKSVQKFGCISNFYTLQGVQV